MQVSIVGSPIFLRSNNQATTNPATEEAPRIRGTLRALKARLDDVKVRAAARGPIQEKLIASYQRAGAKHLTGDKQLQITYIGENTLPVIAAQVTKKTLPELAAQPEVVAILPNQKIRLIKPKEVDYDELGGREKKESSVLIASPFQTRNVRSHFSLVHTVPAL